MDSIVQVRHLFITEIVPIHNFNKNNELTNNITNIMELIQLIAKENVDYMQLCSCKQQQTYDAMSTIR